jgi:hypothetical protein
MSNVRAWRGGGRALVLAALGLVVPLAVVASDVADLRHAHIAPGTLMTAGSGRIAAVSPDGSTLTVWDERGDLRGSHRVRPAGTDFHPVGVALRGDRALIAYDAGDEKGVDAILVDLATGRERGRFVVTQYPSRLAAAPDGWLFERLAPGRAPVLTVVDDAGSLVRRIEPPPTLVARATQRFGDASVAFVRPITVMGGLWAVPSLEYELWSMSAAGAWTRTVVPPCLAVSARNVEGEQARRRMLEQADRSPAAERQHLLDRLAWVRRSGMRLSSYVTAARALSARGDLLAVLSEPFPERDRGRCRLDVWRTGERRLAASLTIAGSCPGFVALAPGGAWLEQDGGVAFVSIALDPRPGPPCP